MAFSCTRPKTRGDLYENNQLKKRLNQSSTEHMELINMNLTDEDIPLIVQKVIKKKKCTSLSLSTNQITSNGIRILVDALKTNKTITHLILSSNPIGDQALTFISELIQNNPTLYHLALSNTDITDNGMNILINTLQSNSTSLRCIDLRENKFITDLSVDSLLQMVEQNQILSACRIDNCGLSQQGKDKLKEAKSIKW